ncbi:hypothetical protein SAMN05443432_10399 [Roseovarius litoreus]|uniref:Uncharacterized protein n=1 Tax=Roseovarius litoreus TaxID=1155722 RepID=A0A1M7DX16_9RHOB|nr:hypothetical protein SAMN05443432_10399 [Roseovarius litoreus]
MGQATLGVGACGEYSELKQSSLARFEGVAAGFFLLDSRKILFS